MLVAASFAATLGVAAYILWSGWASAGAPPRIPVAAHLLALLAVLAEIITRTVKIHWSAAALRIPLRFVTALRVCLGGDFGASITPSRSGAEPARFLILAEAGVPSAHALLILFTELFLEMSSLGVLCFVLASGFRGSGLVVPLMTGIVGGYATIVLSVGAFMYVLAHRNAHGPPPPPARAGPRPPARRGGGGRAPRRPLAHHPALAAVAAHEHRCPEARPAGAHGGCIRRLHGARLAAARGVVPHRAPGGSVAAPRDARALAARLPLWRRGRTSSRWRRGCRVRVQARPYARDVTRGAGWRARLVALLHVLPVCPARRTRRRRHGAPGNSRRAARATAPARAARALRRLRAWGTPSAPRGMRAARDQQPTRSRSACHRVQRPSPSPPPLRHAT